MGLGNLRCLFQPDSGINPTVMGSRQQIQTHAGRRARPSANPSVSCALPSWKSLEGKQEVPDPTSLPPTVTLELVDLFQGIRSSPQIHSCLHFIWKDWHVAYFGRTIGSQSLTTPYFYLPGLK